MSEPSLLPCPFCGGRVAVRWGVMSMAFAMCSTCRARGPESDPAPLKKDCKRAEKQAAERWNSRAG